ncbi:response regulator [Paenibacillus sp. LHD-117]|uniref:response regulator transcription factor n=1 Tax=Paenibacillus sp. LHD-117 TaxID=3071412 RepID=UPI0027DF7CFA|nr:response regulator [Paenibacillus sp. LHD-117]MDQ6421349.1 response regulator [Paenibacillus sp. LHD-117]
MYRLLIVDDEPAIVNGLVQLFRENKEMELDVCKAYSSNEAIEIARKTKLDILISDIRMPQKDGLQLVDEIIYYWPSCRVIFLTGYSEFDYVFEAIRKNVQNYILKTEGIEPVFQEVKKAISKLEEDNRNRLHQEKAQLLIQMAEPIMKKELMESMLSGDSITSLLSQSRYAELDFQIAMDRPFFFLVGQVDRLEVHKIKALQSMQRIVDNHLPASIANEKVIYDGSVLVWLIQPAEELLKRFGSDPSDAESEARGFVSYMKGILELIQNECEDVLDTSVSFGISGNLLGKQDNIHLLVEAVRTMIHNRILLGQKVVIVDLEKSAGSEAARYISGGIRQDDSKKSLIEQIHHYIHEHLSGDVSLTAIADEMHFNPSYLSRYYKQITGHNLFDYIQSTKMNVAINLMMTTSLKLNEIAVKAGFDSPSYFTTFFKKMTGLSPQEYRNSR